MVAVWLLMLGGFVGGSRRTAQQADSFMQLAQFLNAALLSTHVPKRLMHC